MNEIGLTPWFDGKKHKPAHRGVYMLMSGHHVGYQKWDGKRWGPWSEDVATAARTKRGDYASPQYQNDNWRGLTCAAFMSPSRYRVARAGNV